MLFFRFYDMLSRDRLFIDLPFNKKEEKDRNVVCQYILHLIAVLFLGEKMRNLSSTENIPCFFAASYNAFSNDTVPLTTN